MKILEDTSKFPEIKEYSKFTFEPGDIFVVCDPEESTFSHKLITLGQEITNHANPTYVHAGLAVSKNHIVEMSNDKGMALAEITKGLDGQRISVFRCKDKELALLARDLAANMEGSEIINQFNTLDTGKKTNYSLLKAVGSLNSSMSPIGQEGKEQSIKLANDFQFPDRLFCSEMVVMLYALADVILNNRQKTFDIESNINPSVLYEYLTTRAKDNFEEIKITFNSTEYLKSLATDKIQGTRDSLKYSINETIQKITDNSFFGILTSNQKEQISLLRTLDSIVSLTESELSGLNTQDQEQFLRMGCDLMSKLYKTNLSEEQEAQFKDINNRLQELSGMFKNLNVTHEPHNPKGNIQNDNNTIIQPEKSASDDHVLNINQESQTSAHTKKSQTMKHKLLKIKKDSDIQPENSIFIEPEIVLSKPRP